MSCIVVTVLFLVATASGYPASNPEIVSTIFSVLRSNRCQDTWKSRLCPVPRRRSIRSLGVPSCPIVSDLVVTARIVEFDGSRNDVSLRARNSVSG